MKFKNTSVIHQLPFIQNKSRKTKNITFYDFFNYFSFRPQTWIEAWFTVMNTKQQDLQNIYFGQEYIPCLCWTNKQKCKWVTFNFGGYGLPKDCMHNKKRNFL